MGIKLTEREIEKLACPPGKRDCMVFDTEQRGLAVRGGVRQQVLSGAVCGCRAQAPGAAGERRRYQPGSCPHRRPHRHG